MPICMICNKTLKDLGYHINKIHHINKNEYKSTYPDSKLVDDDVLNKRSKGISNSYKKCEKVISQETRDKISLASIKFHKNQKENNYEKYMERQARAAKKARDKKGSDYKHSEDTKNKMKGPRLTMVGRTLSDEHRKNLSIAAKRNIKRSPHSEETKNKLKQN